MNNDCVYLNRRAQEERSAASQSRNVGVRDIHLELAQAYEFRLFVLEQLEGPKAIDQAHREVASSASAASGPLMFEVQPV